MAVLIDGVKGALRVGQTLSVLSSRGVRWVMGERPPPARLLRETFEELGATYIKLGQFIASSPTFFPSEYVEEFRHCLDATRPLPFVVMEGILKEEFKRPLDEIFAHISREPLASASIAQVHAARLVTGEDVVIKIQKPGVRNTLLTDLNFLYVGSRIVERLAPKLSWTSLSGVVETIQKTMMEECDFIQEAGNLKEFRQFLNDTHNVDSVVPRVYEEASTSRVLTMERFYGVPLTDLDSIRRYCEDPERTLISAMNTWFSSLTQCNFFHADLHAGNLMVLEDGRIGFIDFGIVGRISPVAWRSVSAFTSAVMVGDFEAMAEAMLGIGVTDKEVDTAQLAKDLRQLYQTLDGVVDEESLNEPDVNAEEINNILMKIVRLGERHGLHFPREFALLLKQFLYFDRYIHVLAPELDVFMDDRIDLLGMD